MDSSSNVSSGSSSAGRGSASGLLLPGQGSVLSIYQRQKQQVQQQERRRQRTTALIVMACAAAAFIGLPKLLGGSEKQRRTAAPWRLVGGGDGGAAGSDQAPCAGGSAGASKAASLVDAARWREANASRPPPFFIVTAALLPVGGPPDPSRDVEYDWGFSSVTRRGFGTAVVVSHWEGVPHPPWPILDRHNWTVKQHCEPFQLLTSKSAQEGQCLRELALAMAAAPDLPLRPETMVFKVSGRYHVVRDDMLQAVLADPAIDLIARRVPPGTPFLGPSPDQVFTFFYGLKWRHFAEFYAKIDLHSLIEQNVEQVLYDFARARGLNVRLVDQLWVVGDVAGGGNNTLY